MIELRSGLYRGYFLDNIDPAPPEDWLRLGASVLAHERERG